MTLGFKILISSDIEYDDICAEIFYDDQFFGIINQENGLDNLEIEIYPPSNQKCWIFKFSEFEVILKSAKEALWNMRKYEM